MALFEIDPEQLEDLRDSIRELSDNIGKWQAQQTQVIQMGLTGLIAAVTGADVREIQQKISQLTSELKPEAEAFEQSAQTNQSTNEGA